MMCERWLQHALAAMVLVAPVGCVVGDPEGGLGEEGLEDPITYVRRALEEYPIVVLGEGMHSTAEPHELLRSLLSDPSVLRAVDVVIVEFATALQQETLDAYIAGADVPFEELSRVWRDASTSPVNPWDSPLYADLLRVIREANSGLPEDERVRVLAGDPPFAWETVHTRADFEREIQPRDPYVADVAIEQAFGAGKRVLVIFGGAHLPRVPVGPDDDGRNSLTYRILTRHPNSVKAIGFLNTEHLGLADRSGELQPGRVYPTDSHWVGEIDAVRFFPKLSSRVVDPETGAVSWQELPLYSGHSVRDLFDGLVYIGPSSEWTVVPVSLDEDRDAAYLEELDRRSRLRLGRPYRSGG